jgi:hypothetical protein
VSVAPRILSRLLTPARRRDPVADLDDDLRRLCAQLDERRARREHAMVGRISAATDQRLEQRGNILAAQAHATSAAVHPGNGAVDRA